MGAIRPIRRADPEMELAELRASGERWAEIGRLVNTLAHLVQSNALIDTHMHKGRAGEECLELASHIERELTKCEAAVLRAESRLTVELLQVELKVQQRRERR